jgi:hypothetical protein
LSGKKVSLQAKLILLESRVVWENGDIKMPGIKVTGLMDADRASVGEVILATIGLVYMISTFLKDSDA